MLPMKPTLLCLLLISALPAEHVRAQKTVGEQTLVIAMAEELFDSDTPIPREFRYPKIPYKSWSLFLVTDPDWALPEDYSKPNKFNDLYKAFRAFGHAIGDAHAAVWFWSIPPSGSGYGGSVDLLRSRAFCEKLNLPLSKGPYVLVTTQYPGTGLLSSYPEAFPDNLKNFSVIELNGADTHEIMTLLNQVGFQLLTRGTVHIDPRSEGFWRAWQRAFEATRGTLVGFSKKVTVRIKTGFFETEIKL